MSASLLTKGIVQIPTAAAWVEQLGDHTAGTLARGGGAP